MTFAHVLLICSAGIAACAALVFAVETLVAFCFHEQDRGDVVVYTSRPVLVEQRVLDDAPIDKAA